MIFVKNLFSSLAPGPYVIVRSLHIIPTIFSVVFFVQKIVSSAPWPTNHYLSIRLERKIYIVQASRACLSAGIGI